MKVGVIIARMQPIHNGHLELINQALNENEKVLVLVGSANKLNKRNPIPIANRIDLIIKGISEKFGNDVFERGRIMVRQLDDLTDESDNSHDWGFYLYSNIVKCIKEPYFTIYYSDGFQIIMEWFPNFITRDFVSFKLNARGTIYDNLSATQVRDMIVRNDVEQLKDLVPTCVLENIVLLRHFIMAFNNVS